MPVSPISRSWRAVVLVVGVSLVALACAGGGKAGPKPGDPALAEGYQVFQAHCATCHGSGGGGGAGPKLAGVVTKDYPDIAGQIDVITNGKGAGAMPAWKSKLTTEQIKDVAEYTRQCLGTTAHC
jgi:mono/diheme cytochrome c family protein